LRQDQQPVECNRLRPWRLHRVLYRNIIAMWLAKLLLFELNLFLVYSNKGCPTKCMKPDGTMAPCGPGNDQCGKPFTNAPKFHVMDKSCGENDPNGPFYDPVHSMYHLFYQDHLAMPMDGDGNGPDWGHAVSRDFVHWARLPVAIWNDHWYDAKAIYTGSTTIVNGKPVIVYPGIKHGGGFTYAVAIPSDSSDPLYTNWTKPNYNPIANGTSDDPSTAWKTTYGEWRLIGNGAKGGRLFGSKDFVSWYEIGETTLPVGECPSLFELPPLASGTEDDVNDILRATNSSLPTHVHKVGHKGKDWMQFGDWKDPGVHQMGTWEPTPGVSHDEFIIDKGAYYASKDFWDPIKKRRINWGWARVPPASTQSLPRVLTYHPGIQSLLYTPAEELQSLRTKTLASQGQIALSSGSNVSLDKDLWVHKEGNTSEVQAFFTIPAQGSQARFGVTVMTNAGNIGGLQVYVALNRTVLSTPSSSIYIAQVGVRTATHYSRYMPGVDLSGDDYNVTNVDYKDPKVCQAVCDADTKCTTWTYVVRGPKYASCCLKTGYPGISTNPTCTSGVKDPSKAPSSKDVVTDSLKLLPTDNILDIRVFVDNTFIEAYIMDGRVAMTAQVASVSSTGMYISNEGPTTVHLMNATVWTMADIWVTPDQVLATPRQDGNDIA